MGAYVNHEKYKPRNYNHMDYSDVTHAHKNKLLSNVLRSDGTQIVSGANNLKGP